jgi:hypothetical protein
MGDFTARGRGTKYRTAGLQFTSMPPRTHAIERGPAGVYNIAEDDGTVSVKKARKELGFDPAFRFRASVRR